MDNKTIDLLDGNSNRDALKSKSKEEMARIIARNMSANDILSDTDLDSSMTQNSDIQNIEEDILSSAQTNSEMNSSDKDILPDDDIMFGNNHRFTFDDENDQLKEPVRNMPQRRSNGTKKPQNKSEVSAVKNNSKAKVRKKKSSAQKIIAIVCCVFLFLIVASAATIYVLGIKTYKGVFLDHTYINGIDVSGKSESEAYKLVAENSVIPEKMTITLADGSAVSAKLSDIGYIDETQTVISQFYSQQNHYAWFNSKFKNTEYTFEQSFKYDKTKIKDIIDKKIIANKSEKEPENAYITKNDDGSGYVVVKEKAGDKIDSDKLDNLYKYVEDCLNDSTFLIDISDVDCYATAEVTSDMLEESCEKLNNLYNIQITFDFTYTSETLTGDTIMDWIKFDKEDNDKKGYTVDSDKVMKYVEELADKYDTYGKDREFKSTNRGTITVDAGSGCYGWWIDQKKTASLIEDLIEDGDSADTKPIYYTNPDSQYEYTCNSEWRTADKDYGDTYIEIDLSAQHLWYYKNGKVEMESDIVSGYPNESRNTPEGVYKVWYKERSKTLVGSADGVSYASYVDFWNNISTIGIGLHDASWQNGVFGGTKYQSSTWGSHGCINMPYDKAKYVFDNIEMGTPVFAYWS